MSHAVDDFPPSRSRTTPDGSAAKLRAARVGGAPPLAPSRYAPLWELARGGMAVIHLARDRRLGRVVALKRPRDARQVHQRLAVRREGRLLASISHPNVVAIHDAASMWEEPYLALELVNGPNLATWLHARPRHWRQVLAVFLAVGRGLAAVHAASLVHRDVKPSNVLLDSDLRPRLADFGLAMAIGEQAEWALRTSGTPGYMAPEQAAGGRADAATDQYSFGLSLHEALWRDRPPSVRAPSQPIAVAPVRGRVPLGLRAILERATAPERERRYPRMQALIAAIASTMR